MQVSIYTERHLCRHAWRATPPGCSSSGVDPWVRDDLFNYSGHQDEGAHKRQYRLLDAIYSTAARNNVPTGVIGEAIMYLSRGQDLNAFATYERPPGAGLFARRRAARTAFPGGCSTPASTRSENDIECFVFQQSDGEFACVTKDDQVRSLTVTNGMVTPVNGVMTSTFGPRRHPILKTVRIHKGVDWAAPIGTPIMAAFDGAIVFQGDGGGYGNLVKIRIRTGARRAMPTCRNSRPTQPCGTAVKAGDVIGYIGTTGLSTGPHLHFELYHAGQAIDPLGNVTAVVAATVSEPTSDAAPSKR